jgi:hypothetical protein
MDILMPQLLILHICCMALGFVLLLVHGFASHRAAYLPQPEMVVQSLRKVAWMGLAGRAGVLVGLALGLVLAHPYGYTATWLLGAYAATFLSMVIGVAGLEPFQKQLMSAAWSCEDLSAFRQSRRTLYASLGNGALWVVIVWLMVSKPA